MTHCTGRTPAQIEGAAFRQAKSAKRLVQPAFKLIIKTIVARAYAYTRVRSGECEGLVEI
jgi:hypothetical protein